ncbi:MAG: adenylate/guanylate cyclase domain-containing protein [Candidatus Parcubacteria bacterium]|nr:adenylate/guanylate cyclase domain-containing protein [Candidatus Parcubacteria bacterium]
MDEKTAKKSRLSFRTQLVLFGLLLVLIVALPPLIVEIQRPWEELANLISQGKIVVSQVKSDFHPYQLKKMNEFALRINESADPELENYLVWTFNLWFEFCEHETCIMVLTPEYMAKILKAKGMETKNFDFQKLLQAEDFWEKQFASDPRLRIIFKEYKEKLSQARLSAKAAGFDFNDTYVMTDNGQKLVFLLDGSDWWESSYPGLEYDVIKNDCQYFRNYLKNGPGFDTNPVRYHLKIFPKFDTDKWGSWFSVWLAAEVNRGTWNNFALDFDASKVKKLMWTIGIFILSTIAVITLIITLLTSRISDLISKPIKQLIAAAQEVINSNYDIQVPEHGSLEIRNFIAIFNDMVVKLKGRLNLKNMLGKLLSKELAEKVEKEGLIFEGEMVKATLVFTDFAGFSTITKNMGPQEIFQMLNEYFRELIPIIKKWNGFPDKYIGDAIVAIFGAPVKLDNHAELAVSCAIEMQLVLRRLNEVRQKEKKPVLEMRIGINSGEVIVGALGSDEKMDYTSIGETTNLAQRMEAACQIGDILISENTFNQVQTIFFENTDIDEHPQQFEVKGYSNTIAAYNIQVANLKISKNAQAIKSDDFYIMEITDNHLKKFDALTPEEKQRFSKVVKITPA